MDRERFLACCAARYGYAGQVGTLSEKQLHAAVKAYLEPRQQCQEQRVGRVIADIRNEAGVTEVQTRSFQKLRAKLPALLAAGPVTIAYPVAVQKWLYWAHPETGELSGGRKSPKQGADFDILYELYWLRDFLSEENLSVLVLGVAAEEYRLLDGWGNEGKRGSHRQLMQPKDLLWQKRFHVSELATLLPADLPAAFTAKELAKAYKRQPAFGSRAAAVLLAAGVIAKTGQRGRAYLYSVYENENKAAKEEIHQKSKTAKRLLKPCRQATKLKHI